MPRFTLFSLWLVLCASLVSSLATVQPNPLFQSGMVFQKGRPVPVWGEARPGEAVTLTFKGQGVQTIADASGRWLARLPAQSTCSVGSDLVIRGENEIVFSDVLVGEVWLCSGQSNMEWPVEKAADAAAEIAKADYPLIRHLKVKKAQSVATLDKIEGQWLACSPNTVGQFTAVGYYFARRLHEATGEPVGLVNSSWGGTPVESWLSAEGLAGAPAEAALRERQAKWLAEYPEKKRAYEAELKAFEAARDEAKKAGLNFERKAPAEPLHLQHKNWPHGLFGGMIHPLLPMAIRGILWYQGESNAGRPDEYASLFPALIRDWRRRFGQGDLPFYWVQLASFNPNKSLATDTDWARIRDVQTETLALPSTGQVLALDVGNPKDIHPLNKQTVGQRLANLALSKVYGAPGEAESPRCEGVDREGASLRVRLCGAESLRTTDGQAPRGFLIAGTDGVFHAAEASIEKKSLRVQSSLVPEPRQVRYAWCNSPDINLVNELGLPLTPFTWKD